MAIVKMGALVVGVRGTVGGVTFSASLSGPNARLWSRGANPRTRKQGRQRGRVSAMPNLWRLLSDAQRDAWAAFAADPQQEKINSLGEVYYASGYAWFVCINCRLARAGFAHRDDPPTTTTPAAPVIDAFIFEEVASVFTCQVEYDPLEFPSGTGIVLMGAFVPRGGRQVQYPGYRIVLDGIASPTGTYEFPIEWANIYGVPQIGDRAFVRVFKQDDEGLRSTSWNAYASYS